MKNAMLLCLTAVLASCDPKPAPPPAAVEQGPDKKDGNGMDSPIIISDGSPETHLRHKGSAAGDFEIINNGSSDVVQVNDSNFTATSIECLNMSGCSLTTLNAAWTLSIPSSGTPVMVMSSNNTTPVVTTDFQGNPIVPGKDKSSDTNAGTDLNEKGLAFQSASFTLGSAAAATFTCTTSPCKICIHYETPGTTSANESKVCKK